MKTLFTFAAFIVLLLSPQGVMSQTGKFDKGLFWKVSGNGLDKPSYILGTHHLVHNSFLDSIRELDFVMNEVQQVAGEVILSPEAMREAQTKIMQAVMMPEGKSYSSILSGDNYNKLNQFLTEKMNVGLDQFSRLIPAMIGQMCIVFIYKELDPDFVPQEHKAMDDYIQQVARESGKTVLALEEVEDQIRILYAGEPIEQQAEDLLCQIDNWNYSIESLRALNGLYRQGEVKKMYDLAFNNPDYPCKPTPEQRDRINKERNDRWVQKLPAMMKDKSTLIVVGALHLAEDEGLLFQLEQLGYSVTPIVQE